MQITKFEITNYRSLIDFKIDKFDTTTIFFGENNAGKSNILNALYAIFQRKPEIDQSGDFLPAKNFYEGVLRNFTHSFYNQDDTKSIAFTVKLKCNKNELQISKEIEGLFNPWPETIEITITGSINKHSSEIEPGLAEINTTSILIDDIPIYNSPGDYFPSLVSGDRSNASPLRDAFSLFINPLNDCIAIISNNRDMHSISFSHDEEIKSITPKTFKHFLYKLYLSEKNHSVFETINSVFSSPPFAFGNISFSKDGSDLEIMIKEKDIRLPIKHLGSGVLQILYVISEIIYSKSKIICIEELEQNLSPKLQGLALRKIQSMLNTNLNQIIISSHSSVFAKSKYSNAIHLIEKDDDKTIWVEEINDAMGEKAKAHFIPATLPPATFTQDAYTQYQQEL